MTQVIIAARGGAGAKSRLSRVLDGSRRGELTAAMLRDVASALARAPSVSRTWLVTPTPDLEEIGRSLRWRVIRQRGQGLNEAFDLAIPIVRSEVPSEPLIALLGDLPLLQPGEVEALVSIACSSWVALAPARRGGTSAIAMAPGLVFPTSFGPDSFARHQRIARTQGAPAVVLERHGLSKDIDEPEDLAELGRSPARTITGRLLASWPELAAQQ